MKFFLLNAFGMLCDFLPPALMVFLPFPQEALRFRRRRIFAGAVLASAAQAALFPLTLLALYSWAGVRTPEAVHTAGNLYAVCVILIGLAAYIWLVRDALLKKILVVYIVIFYEAVQYWLLNMVDPLSRPLPLYDNASLYCGRSGDSGEPAGWEAFAARGEKGLSSTGLHSIAAVAEKYGGSAQFQRQDGVFTTRVILNPEQERQAEGATSCPSRTDGGGE